MRKKAFPQWEKMPELFRTAIEDDSGPEFVMACEMTGQRLSLRLLMEMLIQGRGRKIVDHLLASGDLSFFEDVALNSLKLGRRVFFGAENKEKGDPGIRNRPVRS